MKSISLTDTQIGKLIDVFSKLKAEDDLNLKKHTDKAFVHTSVYQQIQDPGKSLIVGGKGSGKTALLIGFYNENKNDYVAGEIIKLDTLPFQQLFSFFFQNYQETINIFKDKLESSDNKQDKDVMAINDIKDIIEPLKVSTNAWKRSLLTFSVYIAAKQIIKDEWDLTTYERETILKLIEDLDKIFGGNAGGGISANSPMFFALLVYFFSAVQNVVEKAINMSSPNMAILLATIIKYILENIENSDLEVEEGAKVVSDLLRTKGLSVLLSVDRIDDYFDEFYKIVHKESDDSDQKIKSIKNRKYFMSIILEGLILATRDIKRDSAYSLVHILFTLPKDKFISLRIRERAQLEEDHVVPLRWTPPELKNFVNKRIDLALNNDTEKKTYSWDVIFPFTVSNGTLPAVKEDSLLYIIRHSLWKPRDVQMYILAIFKEMRKHNNYATDDLFRDVVKNRSKEIIRKEFIEEYNVEYPYINKVLNKIENSKIHSVMLYDQICPYFHGLKLSNDIIKPDEIMVRLFKMGLIGTRVIKPNAEFGIEGTVKQNNQNVYYKYCYNTLSDDPFAPDINVVFHPMFYDQLNIIHDKEYVVNELKWDMFQD